MYTLTNEERRHLLNIKTDGGKYTKNIRYNYRGYHRETLYQVLYEYCCLCGIRYFRYRQPKMHQLPLTQGERINAVKYGLEKGFILNVSDSTTNRWKMLF